MRYRLDKDLSSGKSYPPLEQLGPGHVPQNLLKAIPLFFFFRVASNAFPDIGSVGRIEKKSLKKITRSLRI